HSIRHQYATTLYEAGIDAKTAQDLLGHAQIATTMDIYTHISEEKKLKDFMKLATYVANEF
ncbi:site-specific integrase, partial [Klebsiella pneumoniae]|nr:site-specific integrase [Klebsiella pneumoniae]